MGKHWEYANAASQQVGLMVCTVCHKPITEGQYRYRETEAAYLPQHRACCANDPKWAQMEQTATRDRTKLTRLRDAIIENTKGDEMFWLGEILLNVLKEETGFDGQTPVHSPHATQQ